MWRPARTDLRGFHAHEGELTADPAAEWKRCSGPGGVAERRRTAGEDVHVLMPAVFGSDS